MAFSTSSVVDLRWAPENNEWALRAYNTTPVQPRGFFFDLPIDDPRDTARRLCQELRRYLQTQSYTLIGLPTHEFKPRMEYLIRDWLVYNAVNYREWRYELTETAHENSPSVWTLFLTLDQENLSIDFTINA